MILNTNNKFYFFLIFIILSACSGTESSINFVKVHNGSFLLKGKPYYYFGANFWHGAYLGADLVKGDRERLCRELDLLAKHSITNLRVMAASELSDLKMSVKPAFMDSVNMYNEQLLKGMDVLLDEMNKRNMKAVLVLNNYWQWSGGMTQYINWVHGDKIIDPDKTGNWTGYQFQAARFYADKKSNEIYRNYIRAIVNRRNTVNNKIYKQDPTIMSWQLANEPRPAPDANNNSNSYDEFVTWMHETAKFIKEIAPNQLLSTGNEGVNGCRENSELYIDAHNSSYIDYLTFHIWPKNWSWYDATNPDSTFDQALQKTMAYFGEHVYLARRLNKPTVLEEFGLERDGGNYTSESSTEFRDKYLATLFKAIIDSAGNNSPMAGLNFWAWGGEAIANHHDYIWRPGDSFMGDPPQEPQGLNSVFSSDISTLEVFKTYNAELEKLLINK